MNLKLIDNWSIQFKHKLSIKLAALYATFVGVLTANPDMVIGMLGMLPTGPLRIVLSFIVGGVVFAVPTVTALVVQPKLQAELQAKSNGPTN